MKLTTLETGFFKLDGGAMFGVVPKQLWQKINPADSNNMCTWAMRCLLIEDGNKLVLIDTGIGNKQSDKFFSYYDLSGDNNLIKTIQANGYNADEITDVVLTHLHFDHCGGAVNYDRKHEVFTPTFKNAIYHTHEKHWAHAMSPNPREKPSFLKENFIHLETSGQLTFSNENTKISDNISLNIVGGHTESMFVPKIKYNDDIIYYCADLIPSIGHLKINYIMAYDIEPLKSMQERKALLQLALKENAKLFFEHDPKNACIHIKENEHGEAIFDDIYTIT